MCVCEIREKEIKFNKKRKRVNLNNGWLFYFCMYICSEAIALAKLRLPAIDPIIPKLFAEWGDKLQKESTQEELAAMW